MELLTESQSKVYNFIQSYQKSNEKPPTYREIADKMGFASLNAVTSVVNALIKKGYLQKVPGARGIVLSKSFNFKQLHYGQMEEVKSQQVNVLTFLVSKGKPSLQISGLINFDTTFTKDSECFCTFCSDDGLSSSGILQRDLLLIAKKDLEELVGGEFVAILTLDGVLARELKKVNDRNLFVASNRFYSDFSDKDIIDGSFVFLGVISSSLRRY